MVFFDVWEKDARSDGDMILLCPLILFFACIAAPYAPISPEISGLTTFLPTTNSKLRKTASL